MARLINLCSFLTLFFICLYAMVTGTTSQPQNIFFRGDYQYFASVKNFYKFNKMPRSWEDAKRRCEWEGATLYYPTSDAEATAVRAESKRLKLTNYWIGATSLLSEGIFLTIDRLPMSEVHIKWNNGEPNNLKGGEDCVEYKEPGLNDLQCMRTLPYVCKKTLASLEWNTACKLPYADYVYNKALGKCYKFHISPKNWTEAYAICASELSYLAIIDSQDEADFVDELTYGCQEYRPENYIHLGIHNKFGDGWRTVKDIPLENSGYHFCKVLPDGDTEACGGMAEGQLRSAACNQQSPFICEHDLDSL